MTEQVEITVDGVARIVAVDDPTMPLLYALRDELGLSNPRFGCGLGQCDACTVHVDGIPTRSCITPLNSVAGSNVTTLAGLGTAERPHPIQAAWIAEEASQCGYCMNGWIMTAAALLSITVAFSEGFPIHGQPCDLEDRGRGQRRLKQKVALVGGVASGDQDADPSVVQARGCVWRRMQALFLEGLLGDEQRKTGWMRAEAAGDPGPWRQQAIPGRRDWDADGLRDIVCDYVIEHLADDDAVLVIDETGFLKQGKASCGVARQYTGSAGKITNCQIGVFAAYVSRHGHAFVDRVPVSSEGMDRRSRSPGGRVRAPRCRLCDQTTACDENGCTRHRRVCTISGGLPAIRSTVLAISKATTPGGQRLCARGQQRLHVFQSWGKQRSVAGKAADIAVDAALVRTGNAQSAGAGKPKRPRLHV